MKKVILLFIISIFIGMVNVSADDTGSGTNTGPVAVDDSITIDEDELVEIDLLSNDTDDESDTLTITSISNVTDGSGIINGLATGVIFTPFQDFNGDTSFDYVVSDGELTDTGTVNITVNAVNDAPVAIDDLVSLTKNNSVEIDLVGNDTDVDLDDLTVTGFTSILNGVGTINSSGKGIDFTPDTDFLGLINFDYTVSDGEIEDTGTVKIEVIEGNAMPVAEDDEIEVEENTSITFDPRVNDTDSNQDTLTIVGVTNGTNGSTSFTDDDITYIPNDDFVGDDEFTYTISDGNGGESEGKVEVEVYEKEDEDENDDEDDDHKFREKHVVKNIQKEFISAYKDLKKEYKGKMGNRNYRDEYLMKKKELRSEYLTKLKEATGKSKKYSSYGEDTKSEYKNIFKNKYGNKISKLSDSKLETIIGKIDDLIARINNTGNYSENAKKKANTQLLALRELILEYMENDDDIIDIDSLFD